MFTGLAEEIASLRIPLEREAIGEALALYDRLGARIAQAVGDFERTCASVDPAASMSSWLRAHGRLTRRAARRLWAQAALLQRLPVTAGAYAEGWLSAGQVEVLTAVLDDELVQIFATQEADLVPYLARLSVAHTARVMAAWKLHAQPEPAEPAEPERALYVSQTLGDRYELQGSFDAEGGSVVATALRLATEPDRSRTPARRRADALVEVCRHFLDHQQARSGGRHRPHLNVVVDLDDLEAGRGGRVIDGPVLDGATVSRLLCDCALHRVVMAGGSAVLDFGTSTRTIPAALWSALVIRDETCRFPGCDRPSRWCEGHHVVWVTAGGPTELANLVLLCSRHHHVLHQPGWHAKLRPDGDFEVVDPEGEIRTTSPPRTLLLR